MGVEDSVQTAYRTTCHTIAIDPYVVAGVLTDIVAGTPVAARVQKMKAALNMRVRIPETSADTMDRV